MAEFVKSIVRLLTNNMLQHILEIKSGINRVLREVKARKEPSSDKSLISAKQPQQTQQTQQAPQPTSHDLVPTQLHESHDHLRMDPQVLKQIQLLQELQHQQTTQLQHLQLMLVGKLPHKEHPQQQSAQGQLQPQQVRTQEDVQPSLEFREYHVHLQRMQTELSLLLQDSHQKLSADLQGVKRLLESSSHVANGVGVSAARESYFGLGQDGSAPKDSNQKHMSTSSSTLQLHQQKQLAGFTNAQENSSDREVIGDLQRTVWKGALRDFSSQGKKDAAAK